MIRTSDIFPGLMAGTGRAPLWRSGMTLVSCITSLHQKQSLKNSKVDVETTSAGRQKQPGPSLQLVAFFSNRNLWFQPDQPRPAEHQLIQSVWRLWAAADAPRRSINPRQLHLVSLHNVCSSAGF